ncbi:type II toxin-antitoxin system VapC family toxin [Neorhizobium galegae]|uniref:type II toxin-antitoxin system VapC family toxin n=1 Tax=Neorhizobium galegae TaxID=399 RepID=UPI000621CF07|nr:type II toxin-antitoxin system VapC family toxin [Neorhizobium galegae]KAB1125003.1 type II toxin-antitoxin system VapC family toxin [Neorhizobium galegae]MCQ1809863.1 type II toxin-antitoxin system VapC family toxin [Neorhizobium galegae]CDZ61478.1 PilT protein, N-terminal [Neorhizobium galegae bv. orientalis]
MYLLDTNVVSEMRRERPHGAVSAWMTSIDASSLYMSAVVVGEIQIGIERTAASNPERAVELAGWLDDIVSTARILPADAEVFRIWAKFAVRIDDKHIIDALIAATALRHNMTVVTRNVRDFEPLGVRVLNPFEHKM